MTVMFLTALGQSGWQGVWLCHKYREIRDNGGEAATWCCSGVGCSVTSLEQQLLISPCQICYLCSSPSEFSERGPAWGGSCLGQPLSGGAGGRCRCLVSVWSGGVTDISSGLSGIMELPCQIWICPGREGYDSYCVSRELFGSFNCLLFNIPWNVNLQRIHVHEGDV